MIRVQNLAKAFGEKQVFRGLSLTADGPLLLMGPSGCGKTTLLRILMGLERADAGTFAGVGRIAAVFQTDRLCPQLTAAANLRLVSPDLTAAEAEAELCALGFTPAELALPAARLSGGQRRRTALLRALLCRRADTLLLDEPFTGLEEALAARAAATIERLAAGRDTILVTHDAALAARMAWPRLHMP